MTPAAVREAVARDHKLLVERDAADLMGLTNIEPGNQKALRQDLPGALTVRHAETSE
jgi:hypothetical protein